MTRNLTVIGVGVLVGAIATAAAIRVSRNPGNPLYWLRVQAGERPQDTSEVNWLQRHYGPDRHSTWLEEWIIRDFFKDKRDGVFVDVGAADYLDGSNTFYLEKNLGWSGIAIDAQESYRANYVKHRPRTKFFCFFVSDRSGDTAKLFLAGGGGASSSTRSFSEGYGGVKGEVETPTVSLNDLLGAQGISRFDFLSMDIELAEPAALAGLDIRRFHPSLAVVEAHPEVRQQILDYFAANQYVVVGKYLRVDSMNISFMPLGSNVTPFPPEYDAEQWHK